jgi:RND family efflux transporter MFP subunit
MLLAVAGGCTKDKNAEAASPGVSQSGNAADSSSTRTDSAGSGTETRRAVSLPVVAEEARDGDLVLSVTTTAQVRSDADAKIAAEVAGLVDAVLVRPGDRVRKGQVLVRLDPRTFDLAIRQAEAAEAEAQLRYLDNFVPDSIATGKGPSEERRRNAFTRSGLQAARLKLEQAKLDKERSVFTAPFNGVVDRIDVAPGERVTAGAAITHVVDVDHLRIEAAVLEHDLPLIKLGGTAMVTSAAAPTRPVIGHVIAVLPTVDSASRAGRVFVRVNAAGSVLRPGMYADVRLEATRLPNRRLLPSRAIIERDGRPLVFRVEEGRAKWTYVTPGRTNGIDTEILPDSATGEIPVKPGEQVITEGHLTLTHEAPVRVTAARERRP